MNRLFDDRTDGTRWTIVGVSHPTARELADRHYNRKTIGAPTVGPPGKRLVLLAGDDDRRALWITHYPKPGLSLDGLDAFRCSSFRNEGAGLSSELIVEAMLVTRRAWAELEPPDGWLTFVDRSKVKAGGEPGFCYLRAGWRRDRTYQPGPWAKHLVRLVSDLDPRSST